MSQEPNRALSVSPFDLRPLTEEQFSRLASALSEDERHLLLDRGEEAPFCGLLLTEKRQGVYTCRLCGLPLFSASSKFESGTGWPSFTAPLHPDHLRQTRDTSYGLVRLEVTCARCGAHIGHMFRDGPPPTGLRFCLNSGSLEFTAADEALPDRLGRGAPEGEKWRF